MIRQMLDASAARRRRSMVPIFIIALSVVRHVSGSADVLQELRIRSRLPSEIPGVRSLLSEHCRRHSKSGIHGFDGDQGFIKYARYGARKNHMSPLSLAGRQESGRSRLILEGGALGAIVGCAGCLVATGFVLAGGPIAVVVAANAPGSAIALLACAATCRGARSRSALPRTSSRESG